jgi:hypothetical protein
MQGGFGDYGGRDHWEVAEAMDTWEAGQERKARCGDVLPTPKKKYAPPWLQPGIPKGIERDSTQFPMTCKACGHEVNEEWEVDGVGHYDSTECADQCPNCQFYNTF